MFKKIKDKVWNSISQKIEEDFSEEKESLELLLKDELDTLSKSMNERIEKLKGDDREISELEKRIADKRKDLEATNNELREQIRLIEAKAAPSNVWTEAFSLGYSKAWDSMYPIMSEGVLKLKEAIRTKAIDDVSSDVSNRVKNKIESMQNSSLKSVFLIKQKIEELRNTQKNEKLSDDDLYKCAHFISALEWVLEKNK